MGLRFRKSVRIIPGVRLNLGLRGASVSVGGHGVTYNIGAKGSRVTLGLPGTGVSYSQTVSRQNPITLVANSLPAPRRYSLTPLVLVAFIFGLLYIASHSAAPPQPSSAQTSTHASGEIVGSIRPSLPDKPIAIESAPLPRPRPKLASDPIGPPLQVVPNRF
jgi:hypothetical protein